MQNAVVLKSEDHIHRQRSTMLKNARQCSTRRIDNCERNVTYYDIFERHKVSVNRFEHAQRV